MIFGLVMLIAYGITNIIVNGTIFEGLRDLLDKKLMDCRANPKSCIVHESILGNVVKWINCMMCMGFWVGAFLALITAAVPITLFDLHISVVTFVSFPAFAIGVFLFSCLTSGVVWCIHSLNVFFGDGDTPERINHNYNHEINHGE